MAFVKSLKQVADIKPFCKARTRTQRLTCGERSCSRSPFLIIFFTLYYTLELGQYSRLVNAPAINSSLPMLGRIRAWMLFMSTTPARPSSTFTTSRNWRCSHSIRRIVSKYASFAGTFLWNGYYQGIGSNLKWPVRLEFCLNWPSN